MNFVTRAQWGARKPRSVSRNIRPSGIALHYEGPGMGLGWNHSQCASKVRTIQNYHMDGHGWVDIAYTALVCHHGYVYEGRWVGVRTAANGTNDSNDRYYAVCGIFGQGDAFTSEMKQGYSDCISELRRLGAGKEVRPHSDFFSTACPGPLVKLWIKDGLPGAAAPKPDTSLSSEGKIVNGVNRPQGGYSLVGSDGSVFCYDGAPFLGSLPGLNVKVDNIVSMAWTKTGNGYWLVGKDGGVFCFGDAPFRGSYPSLPAEARQGEREFATIVTTNNGYTLISTAAEHYDF